MRAAAAAGSPIVFSGDRNGEVAALVQKYACGIVVTPGDADTLVSALQTWADAPASTAEMGQRARAMLESQFQRQQSLARWRDLLDRLGQSRPQ